MKARAVRLFTFLLAAVVSLVSGCNSAPSGSPEAVGDAFADAYFRLADQQKAKEFTAFGATKMLEREVADVQGLRDNGYTPSEANIDVAVERGARSMRGERVRFDYLIRYKNGDAEQVKHADIELAQVEGQWKVVRLGLSDAPAPPASR
jgi:hypothetical protein